MSHESALLREPVALREELNFVGPLPPGELTKEPRHKARECTGLVCAPTPHNNKGAKGEARKHL